MNYIVATLLRKAYEKQEVLTTEYGITREETWKHLMLLPVDYSEKAIFNEVTREIMSKIQFEHGGEEYDEGYPKGLPSSVEITTSDGKSYDSGMVMYPGGHALNDNVDLGSVL